MAVFEDLIQEVLLNVEGYLGDQDVYGTVTDGGGAGTFWDAADTTVGTVAGGVYPDGSGFTAGLIEVGDELIYAEEFDRATGVFSGCLRGWRGTTAVAHVDGEPVRNNPRFPRITVKRAINDAVVNVFPSVSAVKTTEFAGVGGTVRYALPADARAVLSVRYSEPGSSGYWSECKIWRFDPSPGGGAAGERSIDILDAIPGRMIRVTYRAEPSPLSGLADDFETVTGLEGFMRDVVVYGATARLVSPVELAKISGTSAAQKLLNEVSPVGVGSEQAKMWWGLYQQRLQEAIVRYRQLYPLNKHFVPSW